jgi:hypothetical protein
MIHNILFTNEAHFICNGINNTRDSHLWDRENSTGTLESNYEHHFAVNMWCSFIFGHLIGPCIFPQRLRGDTNSLQHELPALLENVRLQTQCQMYRHDRVPPHFSQVIRQGLNQ